MAPYLAGDYKSPKLDKALGDDEGMRKAFEGPVQYIQNVMLWFFFFCLVGFSELF